MPTPPATSQPRLRTALRVCLSTVGLAPAGPRQPAAPAEAWRVGRDVPGIGPVSALRRGHPGGKRVVLVHGSPGSAQGWRDFLHDPLPGADLVAVDRLGFGHSRADRPWPTLDEQAAAVVAWLPEGGRQAVLVGHSLGGAVVARVAADHPARIAAVVWLAAALDPALESVHPLQRLAAWPPVRALLPAVLRHANAELMALRPELERLRADLPRITARAAIVHGTRDRLVPVANVDYLRTHARGLAEPRIWLLDGQDHFLPWAAVREVRAAIAWALGQP